MVTSKMRHQHRTKRHAINPTDS